MQASSSNPAIQQAFVNWAAKFKLSDKEDVQIYRWCQAAFFGGADATGGNKAQLPTVELTVDGVKYKMEPKTALLPSEGQKS